jgi:hypothetical protein
LLDAGSGRKLGFFRGFATGSGRETVAGGSVQDLTARGLEASYEDLAALLKDEMEHVVKGRRPAAP